VDLGLVVYLLTSPYTLLGVLVKRMRLQHSVVVVFLVGTASVVSLVVPTAVCVAQ